MKENRFETAISKLNETVRDILSKMDNNVQNQTFEIRLRASQPIQVFGSYGTLFVKKDSSVLIDFKKCDFLVDKYQIKDSLNRICDFSLHKYLPQLQNGFITVNGGHRIGIAGSAVLKDGEIYNLNDISSLNIRISNEVIDCSKIIPDDIVFSNESLIISGPPASGKTTVLRDIARRLSNCGNKVVVVDERLEISSMYDCVAQNDIGPCCDVLNSFPKEKGIMVALRTLSPQVIICDEIGFLGETNAILQGLNSGVRFIISMHSANFDSLKNKPQFELLKSSNEFGYVVLLSFKKAEIFKLR